MIFFYWNNNLPVISTLLWYRNQELSIPSKELIDCCQNELVGLKRRPTFPYIPLFGQLPRLEAHHSEARSSVVSSARLRSPSRLCLLFQDRVVICESVGGRSTYANCGLPRPRVRLGSLTLGQNLFLQWQFSITAVAVACSQSRHAVPLSSHVLLTKLAVLCFVDISLS